MTTICSQEGFRDSIEREDARARRSGGTFSVVDFYVKDAGSEGKVVTNLLDVLHRRLRSTDEVGWLTKHHVGVLLYGTAFEEARLFAQSIMQLIPVVVKPSYTIYNYPMQHHGDTSRPAGEHTTDRAALNSEMIQKNEVKTIRELDLLYSYAMPLWKRTLDVVGSAFLLLIFSPLFLALSCYIKLVSPGPVMFRQTRLGYGGKLFTLYKFRTMAVNVSTETHRRYLSEIIHEGDDQEVSGRPMVKPDNPQVIPCGRFFRAAGIDELPQLVNVLRGEMSLVGPRPPIPYEVKEYARWHTGRFDTVPGMTGLWQVSGKNTLTFKQMVRLDIRYARQKSFWLDMKILCATPLVLYRQMRSSLNRKSHEKAGMR